MTGLTEKIGKALVVGAGIGGVRAAIDLAQMGYGVTLIDREAHMGGMLSRLDAQFPTNHCGMCRMLPMVGRNAGIQTCLRKGLFHEKIEILLGTRLVAVTGEPGRFEATLEQAPRPVDAERCIGCHRCAEVCPVECADAFNHGLTRRKAIYLPAPHTIPNIYTIDPEACTRCGACRPVCPTGAIDLSVLGRGAFRILVVDDESIVRNSLDAWLGDEEGYTVETAASGPEALEKLAETPFHLMLLDIKMPGMDGVAVLEKARAMQPSLQTLMMTAYATVETAVEAMKFGALDYLIKPFAPEDLIPKITGVYDADKEGARLKRPVGAIVLATGTVCADPSTGKNPMGYGVVPNVVTGLAFERLLSGTGPDGGRLLRPSDKRPAKRVAWIQCVGSRDLQADADFCSTVCCMAALKEAAMARSTIGEDFQATIIHMDLRTFGKSFERYGRRIESSGGVRLIRARVHSIAPTPGSDDVTLRWTLATGAIQTEVFDLAVLSVGQRPAGGIARLAEVLGIDTDAHGFVNTAAFSETITARPGILAGGPLTGPTDIAESVIRASSAALNASRVIHRAGGALAEASPPPSVAARDVSQEPPRILVIRCRCHARQAHHPEPDAPAKRLSRDPAVARVMDLDAICTADGWQALKATDATGVNRVLIAACRAFVYRAKTRSLAGAWGLHPCLIESVIVDDDPEPEAAVATAAIMGGLARLKNLSLEEIPHPSISRRVLVVGGGIAGMRAALSIADHGVPVTLVEASDRLGGNLAWLHRTIDGTPVAPFLEETVGRITGHPEITAMMNSRVVGAFGRAGHVISSIETADAPATTLEHGAVILATGGREAVPDAYGYGASEAVVTQRELERRIGDNRIDVERLNAVAMILCVGSREEPRNYCSRVCCPTALKQALWLKNRNPDLSIFIFYRDMMTCGLAERWYTEARGQGILFFQYRPEAKPRVSTSGDESAPVRVRAHDPILDAPVEIAADLLVLATGIEARLPEALALAYGAKRDRDGFFEEADSKWRPVEALRAGVFACGIALSPRDIAQSVATAEAAAGRALALLDALKQPAAQPTAIVRHTLCSLCQRCIEACPYEARFLDEAERRVRVDAAMCQGCGECATVCPNGASIVEGFSHRGFLATIDGAAATG